jgi:hypothetical protein
VARTSGCQPQLAGLSGSPAEGTTTAGEQHSAALIALATAVVQWAGGEVRAAVAGSCGESANYTFVSDTPRNIFPDNTGYLQQHFSKLSCGVYLPFRTRYEKV